MAKSRRSFIISIVMLIAGMSVGFLLLGTVYTGPRWIAFMVFLVYLFILFMVIRFSKRYSDELKKSEAKDK